MELHKQPFQVRAAALSHHFHLVPANITAPPFEVHSGGFLENEGAEANSLHPAVNKRV